MGELTKKWANPIKEMGKPSREKGMSYQDTNPTTLTLPLTQTSPHTSSNTYKAQNVVVNLALRIVS